MKVKCQSCKTKKYFLIENGYFDTLYLINRQITNLEVVPDTD